MMGRFQVICTTDQIKEAKHNVQKYMRKHKSDEDFIENISDDFVMGFMISQRMSWDDYDNGTRRENDDFGKWIPCSERLPKDRQIVVADIECGIEDRMCIFAYFKIVDHMECWINANTGFPVLANVVQWTPLPEPYKQNDEGAED